MDDLTMVCLTIIIVNIIWAAVWNSVQTERIKNRPRSILEHKGDT